MGIIYGLVNGCIKGFSEIGILLLSLLPDSPLKLDSLGTVGEIVGYINYFVPITWCINVGLAWLSCISFWYIIQWALRWVKMIE